MSPRFLVACVALSWAAAVAAQQAGTGSAKPLQAAAGAAAPAPTVAQTTARVDYARDIQPLLAKRCGECHNATKRKGGLALDSYEAAAGSVPWRTS